MDGTVATDKNTFPALVRTLPRNGLRKNEKHGLRDRSHEHMGHVPKKKNDDNSQQTRTLVSS
jgi:hypothetical protein